MTGEQFRVFWQCYASLECASCILPRRPRAPVPFDQIRLRWKLAALAQFGHEKLCGLLLWAKTPRSFTQFTNVIVTNRLQTKLILLSLAHTGIERAACISSKPCR